MPWGHSPRETDDASYHVFIDIVLRKMLHTSMRRETHVFCYSFPAQMEKCSEKTRKVEALVGLISESRRIRASPAEKTPGCALRTHPVFGPLLRKRTLRDGFSRTVSLSLPPLEVRQQDPEPTHPDRTEGGFPHRRSPAQPRIRRHGNGEHRSLRESGGR